MLPTISHLQFFILQLLVAGEMSGPDLQDALAKNGSKKSRPAFYQLMARLEEAGLIEGWYEVERIDDVTIKIRWYKILAPGIDAVRSVSAFYQSRMLVEGV